MKRNLLNNVPVYFVESRYLDRPFGPSARIYLNNDHVFFDYLGFITLKGQVNLTIVTLKDKRRYLGKSILSFTILLSLKEILRQFSGNLRIRNIKITSLCYGCNFKSDIIYTWRNNSTALLLLLHFYYFTLYTLNIARVQNINHDKSLLYVTFYNIY